MITCYGITKEWFEDVKNDINYVEAYEIAEGAWAGEIELELGTEENVKVFEEVSKAKGWML